MPQLDISTYVTQYLWLLIMLGVLYYKVENSKELKEIMKLRKKKIRIITSLLVLLINITY